MALTWFPIRNHGSRPIRVIFNIKGNLYRLIVRIHFNTGIIFIRFVGAQAAYNRIDAGKI